jgi:hypothetical protein
VSAAGDLIKSALDYLLGGPAVGGPEEDRLRRWFALPGPDLVVPHARARYVVVATDGRATDRDRRASALVAVTIDRLQLDFSGCFSAQLRASPAGEPKHAVLDFLEFLQKAPLVAFEAALERARVERMVKTLLGVPLRHAWIDLGALLQALFRDAGCVSLDDWVAHLRITTIVREPPLRTALASAQLLQVALDAAVHAGAPNARALIDLTHALPFVRAS